MRSMPRVVIGAPWSGSGKTTVTAALLAGFQERGLRVQSFKVGPDYIDGTFHTALTGRPFRNLDLWMGGPLDVQRQLVSGIEGADLAVIEGVMGLFDSGAPGDVPASTAEVARGLEAPVILVVDAARMAESVAAVVHGFHTLDDGSRLAGVILNRVASPGHHALLTRAIKRHTGVPVLGYLPDRPDLALPERHLGLVPAVAREDLVDRARAWAAVTRDTLDWEAIRRLAEEAPPVDEPSEPLPGPLPVAPIPVALAYDEAFHFYYTANLEILRALGAELLPFSPLRGEPIPSEARLLYTGGGFPEEFLPEFRALGTAHADYRARIEAGLLTLAECGGYIWLSESLERGAEEAVPLVGVVPRRMRLESRLQGFGYRTALARPGGPWPPGTRFRGHEFHHVRVVGPEIGDGDAAWRVETRTRSGWDGYRAPRLAAGFTHLYFPSNIGAVAHLLQLASGAQ
jgi:cobyrinic acid a,c-diamide synthase